MIGTVYPAGLEGWAGSGRSWQVGFLGGETEGVASGWETGPADSPASQPR